MAIDKGKLNIIKQSISSKLDKIGPVSEWRDEGTGWRVSHGYANPKINTQNINSIIKELSNLKKKIG